MFRKISRAHHLQRYHDISEFLFWELSQITKLDKISNGKIFNASSMGDRVEKSRYFG